MTLWLLVAAMISVDDKTKIPSHLQDRPTELYIREKRKIVKAPPELLRVARTYPRFANKGKILRGRRITILTEKSQFNVGERVWVLHVLEAVRPGPMVHVMGPKLVYDEFVDNINRRPLPRNPVAIYDGAVLKGPAVDFHYDLTWYTFDTPGKHTIVWKGGGHLIEGKLGLVSNTISVNVIRK